jgi:hypothetical protein
MKAEWELNTSFLDWVFETSLVLSLNEGGMKRMESWFEREKVELTGIDIRRKFCCQS